MVQCRHLQELKIDTTTDLDNTWQPNHTIRMESNTSVAMREVEINFDRFPTMMYSLRLLFTALAVLLLLHIWCLKKEISLGQR